jgi:exonuclease III
VLPAASVCSSGRGRGSSGGGLICAWPSSFASVFETRRAIERALGGSLRGSVVSVAAVQFRNYPVRLDIRLSEYSSAGAVLEALKLKKGQLGFRRVKIHEAYHVRKRKEALPGDWWGLAEKGGAYLGICTLNLHGGLVGKKAELAAWAGARQVGVLLLQETTRPSWASQGQAVIPGFDGNDVAAMRGVPGARGVGCWTRKGVESRPFYVTALERYSAYKGLAFRRVRIPGENRWLMTGSVYLTAGGRRKDALTEIKWAVRRLLEKYPDDIVVLGGDFNLSAERLDKLLARDWVIPMCRVKLAGSSLTFHTTRVMSSLDHFIVTTRDQHLVSGAAVDRTWDNSDHWPVVLRLKLPLGGGERPDGSEQLGEGGLDGWTIPGVRARVALDRRAIAGKRAEVACSNRYQALATLCDSGGDISGSRDEIQDSVEKLAEGFLDANGVVASEEGLVVKPRKSGETRLHFTLDRGTRCLITGRHNLAKVMVAEAFRGLSDSESGTVDRVSFDAQKQARLEEIRSHYRAACKEVTRRIKESKRSSWLRHVARGASYMVQNDAKRAWRWAKSQLVDPDGGQTRPVQSRVVQPVYEVQGRSATPAPKLCVDPLEVAQVWTEYYRDLLSDKTGHSKLGVSYWGKVAADMEVPCLPSLSCPATDGAISWREVNDVLRSFSGSKAAGPSGFSPDWFKVAEEDPKGVGEHSAPASALGKVLLGFCNRVFSSAYIPERWRAAEVVNIHKGGDPTVVSNYRGISLIEIPIKVVTAVVTRRVSNALERAGHISDCQAGFRRDEEAMAHAVALHEMVGRRLIRGKTTFLAFIDVKKAFDTVPHGAMLQKLELMGIRGRCHGFFAGLYESSAVRIRVGSALTEEIPVERGVRQGCPSSPLLFNVFINDILKDCTQLGIKVLSGSPRGVVVQNNGSDGRRVSGLMFADDLVLICPSRKRLRRALATLTKWADAWELEFNAGKCGIMGVGSKGGSAKGGGQWVLQGVSVPVVSRYKYLGCWFTETWDFDSMLREHESRVLRTLHMSMSFLRNTSVPIAMRVMVYKGQVLPVASYGGELFGMCAARSTRTQRLVNRGLKALVRAREFSPVGSTLPLMLELGIPSIHAIWSGHRARLFAKVRESKTVVRSLVCSKARGSRKGTWMSLTRRWLLVYGPKEAAFGEGVVLGADGVAAVAPKVLGRVVRKFLMDKLLEQRSNLVSLKWYIDCDFASTRGFIRESLKFPGLSRGMVLLTRLRTGWGRTAQRWAQMGAGPEEWHETCPFCRVRGSPETAKHLMLECKRWRRNRKMTGLKKARRAVASLWRSLDPDGGVLSELEVLIRLLGGKSTEGTVEWWLKSCLFYARQRKLGGIPMAEVLVDPVISLPGENAVGVRPGKRLKSRKLPCYAVAAGFLMSCEKERNQIFAAYQPFHSSQSPQGQGSL